jgi:hypothetical protein
VGFRPAKAGLAASKTEARVKEAFMMKWDIDILGWNGELLEDTAE